MASEDGSGSSSSGMWRKLGLSGLVAAVGAGVGLLFTTKPKRLRQSVSELPETARNLVDDLTQRAQRDGDADTSSRPMPQEVSDDFEARRRERRERRERRRHHATS